MGVSDKPHRPIILVVDDTPDNIALIHELLRDKYKIKAAINGEKALAIAGGEPPPDLILLDIMMPGLSGYDVCQRLKAAPGTRHIPIIFLTAKTTPEEQAKGLAMGAADFIAKPVDPPVVLEHVEAQLKAKTVGDLLHDSPPLLEPGAVTRASATRGPTAGDPAKE